MKPVRLAILGLGTVGGGALKLLKENAAEIRRRTGREIEITHVGTRRPRPDLELPASVKQSADLLDIVRQPDVDVVVEVMGGIHPAYEIIREAIIHGKQVVTANKALLAEHGNELFKLAEDNAVQIAYEAAVAGGIPIIKVIREGLAANKIEWLAGIINGTGNFILSEMREKGRAFDDVLKEAQELGYAEADPTFDVEGIDAAHKLTILASCAFGIPLQFDKVFTEGISKVTAQIKAAMDDKMARRTAKQPLEYPSAGSTFKRPEGYFAGALIEECGLKGYSIGGAQVSEKHAGFVINKGGATTNDILALIRHIQETVLREKGVQLQTEVEFIGEV